jgi:hypothetical protein
MRNSQFNSGQPEDCDNIQWPALEIISVQLGQSLTPQILPYPNDSAKKRKPVYTREYGHRGSAAQRTLNIRTEWNWANGLEQKSCARLSPIVIIRGNCGALSVLGHETVKGFFEKLFGACLSWHFCDMIKSLLVPFRAFPAKH